MPVVGIGSPSLHTFKDRDKIPYTGPQAVLDALLGKTEQGLLMYGVCVGKTAYAKMRDAALDGAALAPHVTWYHEIRDDGMAGWIKIDKRSYLLFVDLQGGFVPEGHFALINEADQEG